ncbi:hypothetical protein EPX89_28170 [Escherichia coli]|nr:hypothetical protein [Escherichia coli]
MKLIIFILIVLIIAALLIRIILRSVNQHSPLLMQLHAAGIRTGDAERILSGGEYWQRQKTLLTEREVSFMKGLFRIVDMKRWYLCPGNDSNLLIVFYVQIMPDDLVMQLHRF